LLAAPTGLREVTLRRCVRVWAEAVEPAIEFQTLSAKLEQFFEDYSGFLIQTVDEELSGLDDVQHPYEQILSYAADEPAREGGPLLRDFALEECRQNFADHADALELRNAHLILAEEAIRQQTIIFRHGPEVSEQYIRPFRRLLQGLYHGSLSLPTTE
jgi:chaperonin cofactor prefoldin